MIYTVTFNPSIDYIVRVRPFALGETNRTSAETLCAGGKGVNVALALRKLGHPARAIAFTAGFTGAEIEKRLRAEGLDCDFIRVSGESRINVKIKSDVETEINGRGADVDETAFSLLLEKLKILRPGDWLALSGNATKGAAWNLYVRIMNALPDGVRVTVDAHGELLRSTLPLRPFLVKPNLDELGDLFGRKLSAEDAPMYAARLRESGARNAVVSLGGKGAVMAAEDGALYSLPAPEGRLVNSTGAGDSLVAGFIAGYIETGDVRSAFRFGVATGSACAFSEGFAERREAETLLPSLAVREERA